MSGRENPIDFYGKGKYDIVEFVGAFRYFGGLCGGCSPAPGVVFSYDNKTGKYVVSSKKFANYLLRDIGKDMREFEAIVIKNENYDDWLSGMLKVFLSYIYAGQETKGWEFYNSKYAFTNKEEMRRDIIERLNSDPVYKEIYER